MRRPSGNGRKRRAERQTSLAPFEPATPDSDGNGGAEARAAAEAARHAPLPPRPAYGARVAGPSIGARARQNARDMVRAANIRDIKGGYGPTPLYLLSSFSLVSLFAASASGLVLPEVQREFEINLGSLFLITTVIGVFSIMMAGPIGFLGDRWRRTTMTAIGSLIAALGQFMVGLAPNRTAWLGSRILANEGGVLSSSVSFSLLSDYYPLEERPRAVAFLRVGGRTAAILAPFVVGTIGTIWGWRAPFLIFGGVSTLVALLLFRLREPIRGYHERLAYGADVETARREQEAPSWGESWRAAWAIRTVRRLGIATPLTLITERALATFLPVFQFRVFNLSLFERAQLGVLFAAVGIFGVLYGGARFSRIIGRNPGRVVILAGLFTIAGALTNVGIVLSRNLGVYIAINVVFTFLAAMVGPAAFSVYSSVIPPRLRNLGLAVLDYWELVPLVASAPIVAYVADTYGLRAGILMFSPLLIIGAIISMSAAPFVEFDIRSANSAAMAHEVWRLAKEEGRAKMLVIRGLDVHYNTVQVLFDIDLDVEEGEILALLGTNGAGKSTLLRAISGTHQATGGAIVFDGRDTTRVPPYEIVADGVVHMPGGRSIFPNLSVRENLTLAGWLYGQEEKHVEEVEQIFRYFPILRERLGQLAGTLSGGEQQMLGLAQAFLSRPRLLLIDELSLGLAPAVIEQLLEIIRAIHSRGTTIMLVEQSVNIALTVAERAIFMEKGEIRFDGPTADLLKRPDILRAVFLKGAAAMGDAIRASIQDTPDRAVFLGTARRAADEARVPVLVLEDLRKSYGGVTAVESASMTLHEGEILGLIGPNGAGKTTVLEMASGFVAPDGGRVIYEGRDITAMPPEERAKLRLIRRFQDARLFPSLTVAETLAVAFEREFEVRSIFLEGLQLPQARIAEQRVRRRVDRLIELLELSAYRDKFISELSTGTRRVVDLACVLATEPKVLLLDEPSSGMAQREAESLVPLLLRVRQETGCSMMVVEHDIPLISSLADELVAMDLGTVVIRGTPEVVLEDERVVRAYLGTSEEAIQRSGASKG